LVVVEPLEDAFDLGAANQPGEIVGGEPGVVVDQDGAQRAVGADEVGGGVDVVQKWPPPFAVNRREASRAGLTDRQ
jgi:hypothetical protein